MYADQDRHDVRCEWGPPGLETVARGVDAVVVVDVLSFSTCIDVATAGRAMVFPGVWKDARAAEQACALGAKLAGPREAGGLSLSPVSMRALQPGERLVLPSPNGATITLAASKLGATVFAGCLRNASAVAAAARACGPRAAVIACGERWPDGTLRFALEDLLGAGAIVAGLAGRWSPEASAAAALFRATRDRLPETLAGCASGRELIERGFPDDVAIAAELDASGTAPRLDDVGGTPAFR
jgi:2-phosphosulfolactate phosphatase